MTVVFLDSNVIISALIGAPNSPPAVLVDWIAGSSSASLVTGRCCVQEVDRVLQRKLPSARALWRQFLQASRIVVVSCPRKSLHGINAKDEPIVAAAVAASARCFVAGDKHLIAEIRGAKAALPAAVTPRELLEEFLAAGL